MNNPYRLFSLVFSYPTPEAVRDVADLPDGVRDLFPKCAGMLAGTALEELQAEYTRLFINSYPALLCPPYESFYREGIVYGKSSQEVLAIYGEHGLDYSYEGEPPDHISAELDFLALTDDGRFLGRLKEWVFSFSERVREHSPIYGACAAELESFLKAETRV